mgnify:CR=1 FL=1
MPLHSKNAGDCRGTERDGSKSEKWCSLCYVGGAFVNPTCTVNEMIDIVDDAPTALETLLDADAEARYRRAFAELPERDRAALVARSMGYTYEQVAAVAGHSSADAARIALTRIVKRLRAVVDGGPPKAG